MYAIIETGGKQFKVSQGDVIFVEKLNAQVDDVVSFDVLMISNDAGVTIGAPIVPAAKVEGKVLAQGKNEKIIVFKYKAKKGYRRKNGHRQPHTRVEITAIS